ncbi:MAG TPA: putative Ig domain-containing protein [Gammaproteobacteria bacterium]|nr:putative Ig domain-containing protein [Gammaproteobacteria bacterium]
MGNLVPNAKVFWALAICVALAGCGGGGGSDSSTADQSPSGSGSATGNGSDGQSTVANSKPTISGTPATAAVTNQTYVFAPQAEDADNDVLTFQVQNLPGWATFDMASGKLQGKPASSDVGKYDNIVISVTDGADSAALNAFAITVQDVAPGSVELSWQAPTENEDGSPLTDLAGYKIYWGTAPGEYPNSVTIDNPGVLTYLVQNLASATYYFVATAFNSDGAESQPSEMATATL